jgi:hypothetical protein
VILTRRGVEYTLDQVPRLPRNYIHIGFTCKDFARGVVNLTRQYPYFDVDQFILKFKNHLLKLNIN